MEERSPAEVKVKEDLYQELRSSDTLWWQQKVACDLWTYAYFAPLQPQTSGRPNTVPTTDSVRQALANRSTQPQMEATAISASLTNAFFHWPLEFPDVFENNGGFDVVLGNPPWERYQAAERRSSSSSIHDDQTHSRRSQQELLRDRLIRVLLPTD